MASVEGQVDDTVGRGGGRGEALQIVEVASVHLGTGGRQRGGGLVRAGQADDLVSRVEKFGNDGGADVPGGSGDEYAHGVRLPAGGSPRGGKPDVSSCHHHSAHVSLCHHHDVRFCHRG
ncbi:hypothetical protein GCM10009527_082930 [Actinomadura nitritigenes]